MRRGDSGGRGRCDAQTNLELDGLTGEECSRDVGDQTADEVVARCGLGERHFEQSVEQMTSWLVVDWILSFTSQRRSWR